MEPSTFPNYPLGEFPNQKKAAPDVKFLFHICIHQEFFNESHFHI